MTNARNPSPAVSPAVRRGLDVVSVLLVAGQIASFWVVSHLPTQDGPIHLEIAAVLRRLHAGGASAAAELFALNPTPEPNWLVHLVLAGLMGSLAPGVAEKVVVTAYALLGALTFAWALRGARPGGGSLLPLGLPLLFAFPFHMGFYNFAFGMALSLAVAGLWLRRARRPGIVGSLVLAVLFLATYLAHPVALVMSYLVVGTLALGAALALRRGGAATATALRATVLAPTLAALPSLALFALYLREDVGRAIERLPASALVKHLATGWSLVSYHPLERALALGWVALVGGAVLAVLLARRQRAPANPPAETSPVPAKSTAPTAAPLLAAVGLALVAYAAAPVALAGGGYLNQRLQLYVFLFLVLWLASRAGERTLSALRTVGAVLAAGFLLVHLLAYRELEPALVEYVEAARNVPAGTTLLALSFDHRGAVGGTPTLKVRPFQHAAGLIAAERDVADLTCFQAAMGYFPVVYRDDRSPYLHLGSMEALEGEQHDLDLAAYEERTGVRIDAVLLWERRHAAPEVQAAWDRRLADFQLVHRSPRERAEVFRRRIAGGPFDHRSE